MKKGASLGMHSTQVNKYPSLSLSYYPPPVSRYTLYTLSRFLSLYLTLTHSLSLSPYFYLMLTKTLCDNNTLAKTKSTEIPKLQFFNLESISRGAETIEAAKNNNWQNRVQILVSFTGSILLLALHRQSERVMPSRYP